VQLSSSTHQLQWAEKCYYVKQLKIQATFRVEVRKTLTGNALFNDGKSPEYDIHATPTKQYPGTFQGEI